LTIDLIGDWISTINLLGAAQGFFLAAVLAGKRRNTAANRLLAAAMFAFSLDLLTTVYHALGWHTVLPQLIGVTYPLPLLYGPIFYLYVKAVSLGGAALRQRDAWHFAPLLPLVLYLVPFYLQPAAEKLALLHATEERTWTPVLTALGNLVFLHSLIYLILSLRLLRRHSVRVRNYFSSIERINLAWLRRMLAGGLVMWFVALAFHIRWLMQAPAAGLNPIEGYGNYVALGMAAYVYTLGYLGLRQQEIFAPPPPRHPDPAAPKPATPESEEADPAEAERAEAAESEARPRYAKSGMGPAQADRLISALLDLMEHEKPYRNNDLTLPELAESLGTSVHNLSEAINTRLDQSFYDFVNRYRVEQVQQRLADPANDHLTILAIGLDAGFSAKSSFNATFKKHTGMTPSQFKQHARSTPLDPS
jgi:AraC-like DNA-binding protein